jgi:single-stranded DNA-binding protein
MAQEPRIEFTGNIGANSELKTSASGKTRITFSVGVTPAKKNGSEYIDGQTIWFNVTSFDEALNPFEFIKGQRVKVTGRMTIRIADNGKTYHDVIADTLEVIAREKQSNIPAGWKAQAPAPYVTDDAPF